MSAQAEHRRVIFEDEDELEMNALFISEILAEVAHVRRLSWSALRGPKYKPVSERV